MDIAALTQQLGPCTERWYNKVNARQKIAAAVERGEKDSPFVLHLGWSNDRLIRKRNRNRIRSLILSA